MCLFIDIQNYFSASSGKEIVIYNFDDQLLNRISVQRYKITSNLKVLYYEYIAREISGGPVVTAPSVRKLTNGEQRSLSDDYRTRVNCKFCFTRTSRKFYFP